VEDEAMSVEDYRKSLEWYYDSRTTLTDNEDTKA